MNRASHCGRRSVALVLAYLLALQVILAAWVVLVPAVAVAASDQGVICATHPDGTPKSNGQPASCPCGPMCISGGCAGGSAPPPAVAFAPVLRTIVPEPLLPFEEALRLRRVASEPERARAPPVLA